MPVLDNIPFTVFIKFVICYEWKKIRNKNPYFYDLSYKATNLEIVKHVNMKPGTY